MTERDAIIIGGGPAGAVAAWRLASVGWNVLLVERRDNGADKCCGLCLHPEAVELVDAMGCGDAIRMASLGVTTRGRVLVEGDRVVVDDRFERGGLIISRRVLDAILRTAAAVAGADVRTETSARIDSVDSAGATVTLSEQGSRSEEHQAPLLIGADGCGSAVARFAGLVDSAKLGRKFGIALDVTIDRRAPALEEAVSMFVADGGYLGVISQRDRRLHCGALVAADAPMPTKPLEAIGWFVDRSPLLTEAFGPGWRSRAERIVASGPMPWRTTARTTSTVALIGDAAGYIEPFTGEGMRWAMESAWELANAIGLGRWTPEARDRYETSWRETISPMHTRCETVARLAASPRLLSGVGTARRWLPAMVREMSDRALRPFVRSLVPR